MTGRVRMAGWVGIARGKNSEAETQMATMGRDLSYLIVNYLLSGQISEYGHCLH